MSKPLPASTVEHAISKLGLSPSCILEVGTGLGQFTSILGSCFPSTPLTSIDRNVRFRDRVPPARRLPQCDYRIADLNDLDGQFDLVAFGSLTQPLLQHFNMQSFEELSSTLSSAFNHLKPGGTLLIVHKVLRADTPAQQVYVDGLLNAMKPDRARLLEESSRTSEFLSKLLEIAGVTVVSTTDICIDDEIKVNSETVASTGWVTIFSALRST